VIDFLELLNLVILKPFRVESMKMRISLALGALPHQETTSLGNRNNLN
jgi:hypothetical protein